MQCEHAQEFFSEYVTGEMDRALAVTLENHLHTCAPCSETVEGLRGLWTTLDQMPMVDPPPSFHASVMERLAAEPEMQERAAASVRRFPTFGRQFQVRALAYAATVVILLLGAEFVQVQRASLGPIGLLFSVMHPAPVLSSQHAVWNANPDGSGTLNVVLQAHAQVNGAASRNRVHIQVQRADGALAPEMAKAFKDGVLTSDRPTTLSIPLARPPQAGVDVVEVTVSPVEAVSAENRTITLPIAPSP